MGAQSNKYPSCTKPWTLPAIMRVSLLLILTFFCSICSGQQSPASELHADEEKDLHLINLKNSPDLFSFRFWSHGQCIDIRILNDSTQLGVVTNFLREVKSYSLEKKIATGEIGPTIHVQKITLSKSEVQKVVDLINRHRIAELPTDDSIKNWQPVLDGEWFAIEQNTAGRYIFKNFGNPKSQVDIPEAARFLNFYSDLNKELNLDDLFWNYFRGLKIKCFTRNGEHTVTCLTKSKSRK